MFTYICMVEFDGFNVGKHTSPMDPWWDMILPGGHVFNHLKGTPKRSPAEFAWNLFLLNLWPVLSDVILHIYIYNHILY